jgi:hypothetical protein
MESSGNRRDEKMAKQLRPRKRVMANIIVTPKQAESQVTVWPFGTTVFRQLQAIREDDDSGGNFMDPNKGFNIVVKRVGSGKDDTEYTLLPSRTVGPLANMLWIEQQKDLRRLVRIPTEDQQERLLRGEDPKDVWSDRGDEDRRTGAVDEDAVVDKAPATAKAAGRTAEDDLFDDEVDLD